MKMYRWNETDTNFIIYEHKFYWMQNKLFKRDIEVFLSFSWLANSLCS